MRKSRVRASLFKRKPELIRIGRFSLLELLGSGRMGEVYAAYDQRLDRKVAIKLVRGHFDHGGAADQRLLREAQTLAQLSHPNVVQVYDAGVFEERVFIAMEFIRGRTMTRWLKTLDDMPRRERERAILDRFIAAGRGLLAAHEAGLTHRDFKPDNIVVGDDGRTRVVDFGLARGQDMDRDRDQGQGQGMQPRLHTVSASTSSQPEDSARARLSDSPSLQSVDSLLEFATASTQPAVDSIADTDTFHTLRGALVGTPVYMAPEVLGGKAATYRSDQFSFCVALFEALHGERPFTGDDIATLEKNIRERGVPAAAFHPSVPAPVRRVITRGLSTEASERFPDMGDLLRELEEWPRRRRRVGFALAFVVLVATIVALIASRSPEQSPSTEDACETEARETLAKIWNAEQRGTVRDAILSPDTAYAHDAWVQRIEPRLEEHAVALEDGYAQVCRLRARDEHQIPESLEKRERCLDENRAFFEETITLSENATVAVMLIAQLTDPDECRQPSEQRANPAPARFSEEERDKLNELYRGLRRAEANFHAGKYDEASELASGIADEAEEMGYADIQAQATLLEAWSRFTRSRKNSSDVLTKLENVKKLALEHQSQLIAFEAFARQIYVQAVTDPEQVAVLELARSWAEPAASGVPTALWAHILMLNNLGTFHMARIEHDQAREYFQRAIDQLDRFPDVRNRLELSNAHLNMAMLTSDPKKRQELMTQVLSLYDEIYGAIHPASLERLASSSNFMPDPERALGTLDLVCKSYRENHSATHSKNLLYCVFDQSLLAMELGRDGEAMDILDTAPEPVNLWVPPTMVKGYRALLAGDLSLARERFASAATKLEPYAGKTWIAWPRASTYLGLGLSEAGLGNHATAIVSLERASEEFEKLIRSNPNNMKYRRRLASSQYSLARSLWPVSSAPPEEATRLRTRALMMEAEDWYRRASPGHEDRLAAMKHWRHQRGIAGPP